MERPDLIDYWPERQNREIQHQAEQSLQIVQNPLDFQETLIEKVILRHFMIPPLELKQNIHKRDQKYVQLRYFLIFFAAILSTARMEKISVRYGKDRCTALWGIKVVMNEIITNKTKKEVYTDIKEEILREHGITFIRLRRQRDSH